MARSIIWQTAPGVNTDFDRQYLEKVVFAGIDSTSIMDGSFTVPADDAIVVVNHNKPYPDPKIERYLAAAKNVVLFHVAAENLYPAEWMYRNARLVFRSYYDPTLRDERVHTLPLGFKSGFLGEADGRSSCGQRNLVWVFAGQLKGHRREMLERFSEIGPNHVMLTDEWNSPEGLSVEELRELYRQTYFVPCPFGWINPDSFRVMEALEQGAIPVTVDFLGRDYFKYVFGDHPFIVARNWRHASDMVRELLDSPAALAERQITVADWYADFKRQLSRDVAVLIDEGDASHLSSQFTHQRQGQSDRIYGARVRWHFSISHRIGKMRTRLGKAIIRRVKR